MCPNCEQSLSACLCLLPYELYNGTPYPDSKWHNGVCTNSKVKSINYDKDDDDDLSEITNDGRDTCIACGKNTKKIMGFTNSYNICQTKRCKMYGR